MRRSLKTMRQSSAVDERMKDLTPRSPVRMKLDAVVRSQYVDCKALTL